MKKIVISEAQDQITDLVFQETSLKRIPAGNVLIVVRGMILAHTVPLAITARPVAVNQDIKAIFFRGDVDPIFGLWCLKVQHRHLLSKVDTAAHGTKRLDMQRLSQIPILAPSMQLQKQFVGLANSFSNYLGHSAEQCDQSNDLFSSLSHKAFKGELP